MSTAITVLNTIGMGKAEESKPEGIPQGSSFRLILFTFVFKTYGLIVSTFVTMTFNLTNKHKLFICLIIKERRVQAQTPLTYSMPGASIMRADENMQAFVFSSCFRTNCQY